MGICLYCKQSRGLFTSVEHVIPESLGNKGHNGKPPITLPKGVVCDRCNNGPLARLDQALIDFELVSLMKTFYSIPSKTGKLPQTKFGNNATLTPFTPGHVLLESNNKKAFVDKGGGKFNLNFLSKRPADAAYRRELARAIYKMTLGCMYRDQPDVAMSARFDPVRRMILGQESFYGYITLVLRAWEPTAENWRCGLEYGFIEGTGLETTVYARFDFIKMSLFTDLESRKPQKPWLHRGDAAEVMKF